MNTNDALAHKVLIQKDEIEYLENKITELRCQIYADDGFGNLCGPCTECGAKMTIIRPGKFRCMSCENIEFLREENKRLEGEIQTMKEKGNSDN